MLSIAIDAVCVATTVVVLWYLLFSRYNRRRGTLVLQWVEAACATRGRVTETKWLNASRLQAHFSFATHWFENARVTINCFLVLSPYSGWFACGGGRKKR